jgi:hypothetical protein
MREASTWVGTLYGTIDRLPDFPNEDKNIVKNKKIT